MSARVLVIEDNRSLGLAIASVAERLKLKAVVVGSLAHAREVLREGDFQGILLDLGLPDGNGLQLLHDAPLVGKATVAVITAHGEIENAIEARKLGVARFFTKPVAFDELEEFLGELQEPVREGEAGELQATTFVGAAPTMQSVFQLTAHACSSREPLVVRGAAGTGRTHLARLVGSHSGGEITWMIASGTTSPEEVQQAYRQAGGGTLVIEELAAMNVAGQRELIRLLNQAGPATRIRLIVTCGEGGLREVVSAGRLEEELYYRLQVLEISLPRLKDRLSDLPALVAHFLGDVEPSGRLKIGEEVIEQLEGYEWPGNLRELRNVVSFLVGARGQAGQVRPQDLPEHLKFEKETASTQEPLQEAIREWLDQLDFAQEDYRTIQGQLEGLLLAELLPRFENKPSRMAAELSINRSTLRKKLRELLPREH
ncbi:MAG: response regulator [Verrucomicrobiota bacterium JB023]|nr:response regulator [Verrucomicrobiota bacterium JB023]